MSEEGGEVVEVPASNGDDSMQPKKEFFHSKVSVAKENGLFGGNPSSEDTHDQLLQMVTELKFQNEFLKSQLEAVKDHPSEECDGSYHQRKGVGQDSGDSEGVKELHEKIESLSKELCVEKQTRLAAEEALKHLQEIHLEADARAQDPTGKLAEA